MNYKKNIDIGSLIKEKVKERGISINDFAKAIHCNRTNVYSIFGRNNIDIEQLLLISKVLEHDFLAEYYAEKDNPEGKVLIILEMSQEKLRDLSSDATTQIIQSWKVSK